MTLIRAIDVILRDITRNDIAFGGKIMLLGGDFRQVLPVVPHGSRTAIIENLIKKSLLWDQFHVFGLTKNMRTHADQQEFAKWILALGNGSLRYTTGSAPPDIVDVPTESKITDDIVTLTVVFPKC